MALSDYHASVADWRLELRRNERKTRWVIALFIVIYRSWLDCRLRYRFRERFYPGVTL